MLEHNTTQSHQYFGYSVAGFNEWLAVGTRGGKIEMFRKDGSDIQADDNFGRSVAMSDDGMTAIVGADGEDTGGTSTGAVYIFIRSGNTWSQQKKIQASDIEGVITSVPRLQLVEMVPLP